MDLKRLSVRIALTVFVLYPMAALALPDTDSDGVSDNVDNCLLVLNNDQRDTDGDGIGNACDPDLNGDCSVNFTDLQILKSVFFSTDDDADLDGDGAVNFGDLSILKAFFFAAPGPTGSQNLCSCVPPAPVGPAPNAEFGGDEVYLLGGLAGNGAAVPGLNNFSDQGGGLYVARIFAAMPGAFGYSIGNQSATIDYCTDSTLMPFNAVDVPAAGCVAPGALEIPAAGCYEFILDTGGSVLPPAVELTLLERLGRWDVEVDAAGGTFTAPDGVQFDIPAGAVGAPTTLTIGELPCAQVDALFDATTLNSHGNRCIGGFIGEPAGLTFAVPVTVTVPADAVTASQERLIWVSNLPGRQDYTVADTQVTLDSAAGTASAAIDKMSLFAAAGATLLSPASRRGPALDACCDITPTPLDCCCTTFTSTSTAGDAAGTDCDCELLGSEIVTEFPLCPGMPVFVDQMFNSSENCPVDFLATLDLPDTTQWVCEQRIAELRLSGTNLDGQTCSMPVPWNWSVADPSVATVEELPPGTSARITGLSGGTTTLAAASNVGTQFSFNTPLTVVSIDGLWTATETGSETCVVDGEPMTLGDSESGPVTVSTSNCNTFTVDIIVPGLDGSSGPLTVTGNPDVPLTFQLQATGASNTLACAIFFATDGTDTDFGDPLCTGGASCQALACSETITTNGQIDRAAFATGLGDSSWTYNASWSETVMGDTTFHNATCSGASTIDFARQ